MSSVTVSLSGNSSVLEADFFPPIELDANHQYECGLVDFQTFNSIPNVDETNNNIAFGVETVYCVPSDENIDTSTQQINRSDSICYDTINIVIPIGSYEITDLYNFVKSKLASEVQFELRVNKNTLKCEIFCSSLIDFTQPNSIRSLLGFKSCKLNRNEWHTSDEHIEINRINTIRVECSIITGSYFNSESVHTLHEFFPSVAAGYKIIETPKNVIYLPLTVRSIHTISLSFVDQNNRLINFRGENIVTRLHIRRVRN